MPLNALRPLIVDDEPLARLRLRMLLAECGFEAANTVPEAANADDAWAQCEAGGVDVLFLDIHMPGDSGVSLAQRLRSLRRPIAVVFVTAYAEHAVEAFELDAVDYLTKPVRRERLAHALEKASAWLTQQRQREAEAHAFLLITDRGRTQRVSLAQVYYVKAELKYLTVCAEGHTHIMDGSLNELEALYPAHWLRIHRNALVNRGLLRALEKIHSADEGDNWFVRLVGLEEKLAVSRRQLASVKEALTARDSING